MTNDEWQNSEEDAARALLPSSFVIGHSSFPLRAGIALGSNLGDRLENLRAARAAVCALPPAAGEPCVSAPVFETEPVGCEPGAGPFLNTVIEIGWRGEVSALFGALQSIERGLGRPADHRRNVSRVLDLDLLYAGDEVCVDERLSLPHPRLDQRRFVLAPLAAIRPELRLPGRRQTVAGLLRELDDPAAVAVFAARW